MWNRFLATLALAAALVLPASAQSKTLILATTTSTQDTGLLDTLIPRFEQKHGFRVKTIAVGSGQAMALGARGEADVLLVHSPEAEQKFMTEGNGLTRRLVMHNDFILVGPKEDPAKVKAQKGAVAAFKAIGAAQATFMSRGDNSGTHAAEKKLWKTAGVTAEGQAWYQQTGLGMGQTLSVAAEKKGYTLTDRGTYLALRKPLGLEILSEGDAALRNVYHVIDVNGTKFPKVNTAGAKAFGDFMVSQEGQELIRTFGVAKFGGPLFFPDAGKKLD